MVLHVNDPGLHIDHAYVLGEGVVVVQASLENVLVLAKLLLEADGGGVHLLVGAAAAPADVPQATYVVFVALVAILHRW